ncbi:AAA family ATPase [Streptomyces sp. NPDC051917]|uniref:AAA family ATPase n=1 Tax=Streptomyces sp. NPDC051917 TaxID=3154754 RepID=UPI0034561350
MSYRGALDVAVVARPGRLTLLGGPPGSGKSTVADALASSVDRPTVHVSTDSLYVWIRSGFVLPYLPEAQRQNEVVQKVMIDAACTYAGGGYDVVLDGILGPWLLDAFRAECRKRDLDLSYVVLRPSLEVTLSRASQREGRHPQGDRADRRPLRSIQEPGPARGERDRFDIPVRGADHGGGRRRSAHGPFRRRVTATACGYLLADTGTKTIGTDATAA